MMRVLGFEEAVIERVSYLVGHHHTYTNINGMDYQILVEADFLVNYFENGSSADTIQKWQKRCFSQNRQIYLYQKLGRRMLFRIWKISLKNREFIFVSKKLCNYSMM